MLTLKLQRRGKKQQAFYRLVAGEKRSKLGGRQTDYLGWYNPHQDKYSFNKEKILHWLKNGAQMTDTVNNLLIKAGVIEGKKIPKHKAAKKSAEAAPQEKTEEKKGI